MWKKDEKGDKVMFKWSATEIPMSFSKGASIDEVSQTIVSRLTLSDDFPHQGNYPLATLSVKVRFKWDLDSYNITKFRLIIKTVHLKQREKIISLCNC